MRRCINDVCADGCVRDLVHVHVCILCTRGCIAGRRGRGRTHVFRILVTFTRAVPLFTPSGVSDICTCVRRFSNGVCYIGYHPSFVKFRFVK